MTENLLIAVGGIIVGTLLAIGINLWMVVHDGVAYLSVSYLLIAAIALLLLGQGAVLAPAWRASRVSPIEATRTV
jgi:putative ABC transport system permease protein